MRRDASAMSIGCSGIGNGPGDAADSHSSVHAERSWRAGLPVRLRERSVSDDVAARNFSLTNGWVSASAVVSHTEPHHTPSAPSASAAAICRPVADPTGGEHRDRRHRVDDLGDQHHRADLAGVPAGLVTLGDHEVDAGGDVTHGVRRLAGQRGDLDALLVRSRDHVRRRCAERVDDQLDRVAEGDVHQRDGLVVGHRRAVVARLAAALAPPTAVARRSGA